ncbi:hypothetical protein IMZ31_21990 (plasmid) [Pontibacillus sp. ALD_SL1]|uniref:hypothetical protein n=1 Tax=Pontibacillus sp. ALD_SL1 TaxID=2777185 RepID=UPI001A9606DA|nr:hypothetical protein [Pontibacillus sp. ALD_SL1]QST02125.1 hypothetical protein IMZ31_21990 [Pontibacillus sp. ALD_SL1]
MDDLKQLREDALLFVQKHKSTILSYYHKQPLPQKIVIKTALKKLKIDIKEIS